jgi:hypothetical protein
VRIEIVMRAGAGILLLQVPGEGEVWIGDPVLQVGPAPVEDLAKLALFDELPGIRNRRSAR